MPRIVLTRALTYEYAGWHFKRGEIRDVPANIYHDMIRRGAARDPDHHVDFVRPALLKNARKGSVVPVIRDCGMGDVLMVSIPLRDLAARNPHVRLLYCVEERYVDLFRGLPFCDVRSITRLRGFYPYGIDLRGYSERARTAWTMDRTDVFSDYLLGGPPSTYDYPIVVTDDERARGHELLDTPAGGQPVLGLVMRASMPNRSWGPDYLARAAQLAGQAGWRVALLDNKPAPGPNHPPWRTFFGPDVIDLTGRVTVHDLKCVVAACRVVLSPDTGTTHLAEAVATRCVTYFTTVPPGLRVRHYRWTRVLYPEGRLPCLGCIHTPTCGQPDPKPCALLSTPDAAWREVEYVHRNEPPWELLACRDPAPADRAVKPPGSNGRKPLSTPLEVV